MNNTVMPELLPEYKQGCRLAIPEWIENEARLINEALDAGVINLPQAQHGLRGSREILGMMSGLVSVTYFVEYPPENLRGRDRGDALLELFQQGMTDPHGERVALVDLLAERRRSVSLAMTTLDESTAEVVRLLNEKKVPVIGWVVVDDKDGYWTNRTNMRETAETTDRVLEWIKINDLEFAGLGFDIEKPLEYIGAAVRGDLKGLVREEGKYLINSLRRRIRDGRAERLLGQLVQKVRDAGYQTEIYAMPHPVKRFTGGMDMREADRYIEMQYTGDLPDFLRRNALALRFMQRVSPKALPALGIVSGKPDESPGRGLSDSPTPGHHLDQAELTEHLAATFRPRLDFAKRELGLRAVHLFALNDASVETMMDRALRDAFMQPVDTL